MAVAVLSSDARHCLPDAETRLKMILFAGWRLAATGFGVSISIADNHQSVQRRICAVLSGQRGQACSKSMSAECNTKARLEAPPKRSKTTDIDNGFQY